MDEPHARARLCAALRRLAAAQRKSPALLTRVWADVTDAAADYLEVLGPAPTPAPAPPPPPPVVPLFAPLPTSIVGPAVLPPGEVGLYHAEVEGALGEVECEWSVDGDVMGPTHLADGVQWSPTPGRTSRLSVRVRDDVGATGLAVLDVSVPDHVPGVA